MSADIFLDGQKIGDGRHREGPVNPDDGGSLIPQAVVGSLTSITSQAVAKLFGLTAAELGFSYRFGDIVRSRTFKQEFMVTAAPINQEMLFAVDEDGTTWHLLHNDVERVP